MNLTQRIAKAAIISEMFLLVFDVCLIGFLLDEFDDLMQKSGRFAEGFCLECWDPTHQFPTEKPIHQRNRWKKGVTIETIYECIINRCLKKTNILNSHKFPLHCCFPLYLFYHDLPWLATKNQKPPVNLARTTRLLPWHLPGRTIRTAWPTPRAAPLVVPRPRPPRSRRRTAMATLPSWRSEGSCALEKWKVGTGYGCFQE